MGRRELLDQLRRDVREYGERERERLKKEATWLKQVRDATGLGKASAAVRDIETLKGVDEINDFLKD